jgi:branched-chain amino acid transport system substrate-binding protein
MQNNILSRGRRTLIQAGGALAGAAALGFPSLVLAQGKTIKVGFVSPQTGPLAPFGEADKFTIEQMNKLLGGGIDIGGKKVAVQILQKDSQSNPNRAG